MNSVRGGESVGRVRWYGLDFGETVMNPLTLHQSALIREIYQSIGRPEEGEGRVRRWYNLRDSVGSRYDAHELRVRELKQYARGRIYSEVFDGDPEVARRFEEGEAKGFTPSTGIRQALSRVKSLGAALSIVSESSSASSAMAIARFLRAHDLAAFFDELVTPAGRFDARGDMIGPEFLGKTKKEGSIYGQLALHLARKGIQTKDAAMVGDDPVLDIRNAKEAGFVSIQYTGVVDRGASPFADLVIRRWDDLPDPVC